MACSVTQLTYHPAFDPYHQIFRTVRLVVQMGAPFDADKLRLADFYLLFPEKILEIRLSRRLRSQASRLKMTPRFPYDRMPESKLLFTRTEHTFQAAIQTMLHDGLLDRDAAQENLLAKGSGLSEISKLFGRAVAANEEEAPLMSFLAELIREFPYLGVDGLKDRTGLDEHRYDAA
jgi:hypothetical protein